MEISLRASLAQKFQQTVKTALYYLKAYKTCFCRRAEKYLFLIRVNPYCRLYHSWFPKSQGDLDTNQSCYADFDGVESPRISILYENIWASRGEVALSSMSKFNWRGTSLGIRSIKLLANLVRSKWLDFGQFPFLGHKHTEIEQDQYPAG